MNRVVRRGRDQGSAAVEFALVLPVLALLIFGIVDFGRMLNAKITLSQAAHEAARAASVVGTDEAAQATLDRMLGSMIADATVEIQACDDPSDIDAIVTVNYQFDFVTPFVGGSDGTWLSAEAVVRCQ